MERAFRLAGLLHLRRLQEEAAAARLAEANRALHVAEEDRDALAVAMAATAFPSQADVTAWQAAAATRASLASLVDEAAVVAEVALRRGRATPPRRAAAPTPVPRRVQPPPAPPPPAPRAGWTATRTRVAMLDKLDERHRAIVRAEDDRIEQQLLDEAAARRRRQEDR